MKYRYLAIVAAALISGCNGADTDPIEQQQQVRPIAWFHPGSVDASEHRELTGVTHVATQAQLSFEVSGKVDRVLVQVGEQVDKGQVLAELDDTNARLNLNQRQSELMEAEALLVEAQQAFDRQSVLRKRKVVGQAELDQAIAKLDSAVSRVAVAKARVAQAQKGVNDTRLLAPYSGIIAGKTIEPSQQIAALNPVFTIHGLNGQVEIKVKIPETIVDRLSVGSVHPVTIPGMALDALPATLTEISGLTDTSNSFTATLSFGYDQGYVRDGLTAIATVSYPRNRDSELTGWYLPNGSYIVAGQDQVKVFRYNESLQQVDALELKVVSLREGGIVVQGPLNGDDYLAEKGVAFLTPGQNVSLLEQGVRRFNP